MTNLAIFDLDNTLIATDSDNAFPEFLIQQGLLDKVEAQAKNAQFYQDYQNACLDIREFVAFQMGAVCGMPRKQLDKLHQQFMQEFIVPYITPMAKMLVQSHRDAGDELLVISSTNEFIITPICREFGIDNVIGTQLKTDEQGGLTGEIVGTPSLGEGKITRLQEWLAKHNKTREQFGKVYFYSDSKNDLPLLEWVDEPVVVNPDDVLHQVALAKGWVILNFV